MAGLVNSISMVRAFRGRAVLSRALSVLLGCVGARQHQLPLLERVWSLSPADPDIVVHDPVRWSQIQAAKHFGQIRRSPEAGASQATSDLQRAAD
jgi:hypothetical protein